MPDQLYSVMDLAEILSVSRKTAYRLVESRKIESYTIGASRRISGAAIAAFLAGSRVPAEDEQSFDQVEAGSEE